MRGYIEEWLQRAIDKLTDERQQTLGTIPVVINDINKNPSTNK
jgi:hypothetical protein